MAYMVNAYCVCGEFLCGWHGLVLVVPSGVGCYM